MNYREAQDYLNSLQMHKIKLGLGAMEAFLDRVSRPDRKLRFVHVAGTNGKGSVSVTLTTVLAAAGYRVGLFTSPHLSSVRERFRINERFIDEAAFARHASRVHRVLGAEKITYFEFTTALALLWFAEEQVDLVVLETGMGGRLDATNVVQPLVTVITNVSMDHEAYLGTTLEAVAGEKAGIIKWGIPLVCGTGEDESRPVIERRCREKEAPLYLLNRDFLALDEDQGQWAWHGGRGALSPFTFGGLRCAMRGAYQRINASLAIAALVLLQGHGYRFSEEQLRRGLAEVRWPGRLEYVVLPRRNGRQGAEKSLRFLIDGAHNPAGVTSLQQTLEADYAFERLILVWGAMQDKDLRQTLPGVAEMARTIVLTKPAGERAAEPAMLQDVLADHLRPRCHQIADALAALHFAEEIAAPEDLIVIAGSLYLIGEIRAHLLGEMVD